MALTYSPGMWATPVDYIQRLRALLDEDHEQGSGEENKRLAEYSAALRLLAGEECATNSAQQRKRTIECLVKLGNEEAIPHEIRALANLAQAHILAEDVQIGQARAVCSRAIAEAIISLGTLHPITLDLRRWEAQWMTFTMMEDLAMRRYLALLKDMKEVAGGEEDAYWETRLESLMPLLVKGAHSAFQRKLQRLIREMLEVKGEAYHLSVKARLWLAQHYIAVLDTNRARDIYKHLHGICSLIEHSQQCAQTDDICGTCFSCDAQYAVTLLLDALDECAAYNQRSPQNMSTTELTFAGQHAVHTTD